MVGKTFNFLSNVPFNFANYSILFFGVLLMFPNLKNRFGAYEKLPILFWANLLILIILLSKGLIDGLFAFALAKSSGFFFSILVILIIKKYGINQNKDLFYFNLVNYLLIFFLFQYSFSMYESILGIPLGDYEIKVYRFGSLVLPTDAIGARDPLLLLNISQSALLGLNFPILGLIGQHNGFGVMLAFYNILFLYAFHKFRRKRFVFSLVVIFLASISNTTRTAIILIVLQNTIYFYNIFIKNRNLRLTLVFATIFSLFGIIYDSLNLFLGYYDKSDTFISRLNIWEILINITLQNLSLSNIVFGVSLSNFGDYITGLNRMSIGSFENQYIFFFLYTGIIGLFSFYLFIILQMNRLLGKINFDDKVFVWLLFLTFFLISLFMDNVVHYAPYTLFTLILLWIRPQKIIDQ